MDSFLCGIAGHVSFTSYPIGNNVADLARRIRHRGPDNEGIWISPGKECALGHARLSVIDLSPLGHQPMLDPETGNCITANAEIYNFQALRRECEDAGYRFRSQSPGAEKPGIGGKQKQRFCILVFSETIDQFFELQPHFIVEGVHFIRPVKPDGCYPLGDLVHRRSSRPNPAWPNPRSRLDPTSRSTSSSAGARTGHIPGL